MELQKNINEYRIIEVQRAVSVFPASDRAYLRPSYLLSFSPSIIRTNDNYYDSQKILIDMKETGRLPLDARFMTQAEGLAVERSYLRVGKDPRTAEEFQDYFKNNRDAWHAWEWTLTGLRVPKRWENGKVDIGTGKYPRIILIGEKEDGEIQIPGGGGKAIIEYDELYGIPIETSKTIQFYKNHYACWYFDPNPKLDEISGQYDIAIVRGGRYDHEDGLLCLIVDANCGRYHTISGSSFRPVYGEIPDTRIALSHNNVEEIKHDIFKKMPLKNINNKGIFLSQEIENKYRL
jgi:hypothetical protein